MSVSSGLVHKLSHHVFPTLLKKQHKIVSVSLKFFSFILIMKPFISGWRNSYTDSDREGLPIQCLYFIAFCCYVSVFFYFQLFQIFSYFIYDLSRVFWSPDWHSRVKWTGVAMQELYQQVDHWWKPGCLSPLFGIIDNTVWYTWYFYDPKKTGISS